MQRLFGSVLATLALTVAAGSGCSSDEDDGGSGDGSGTGGSSEGGSGGTNQGGSSGAAQGGSAGRGGSGATTSGGGSGATGGSGTTGGTGATGGAGTTGGSGGSSGTGTGKSLAADFARKLGREPNFLIGMGNDLENDHNQDGAYTLGVTMDIHYAYLVGLPGQGGWPDWNAGGTFVNILADSADDHGTTPMYDAYSMAAAGEANEAVLTDPGYMGPWWEQMELLFERLAVFDKPAIVHVEPDFWGFQQNLSGGDPESISVLIHDHVDGCDDQPENLVGFGHCIIKLSRMISPKVVIGFHASRWGGTPASMVEFLTAVGADEGDFIGMDMLDRDAGCFEEHTDPNCQRNDGPWYWDETNQTSPNFHEYLAYSKTIGDGLGLPILWWQIPFGVPSDTPGGSAGRYRDNRVRYIFSHIEEFIAAGGVGAAFGVGAGNQTYIDSDGGQFRTAVNAYFDNPVPLE
ncbi:MAG TPA: hypothetical protein VFZ53_09105 [Polyangiaceae bacterium]